MRDIKVVVLGDSGVGKSSLIIQYFQERFAVKYEATIEDVYQKRVEVDAQPTLLTVVDTSGQDIFGGMRYKYIRRCDGVIFVYSVTDGDSFKHLGGIHTQLRRVWGSEPIACVLVGNKCDEDHRVVDSGDARRFAAQLMCPLLEVTAKDHAMAAAVFETLVRSIRGDEAWPDCRSPNVVYPLQVSVGETPGEGWQVEPASASVGEERVEEPAVREGKKEKSGCAMI